MPTEGLYDSANLLSKYQSGFPGKTTKIACPHLKPSQKHTQATGDTRRHTETRASVLFTRDVHTTRTQRTHDLHTA